MPTNNSSKIHIPLGDHFEIQVWEDTRDRWEAWSYADDWPEAKRLSDHARQAACLPGIKVRIKRL
jgi:hypothetical protein